MVLKNPTSTVYILQDVLDQSAKLVFYLQLLFDRDTSQVHISQLFALVSIWFFKQSNRLSWDTRDLTTLLQVGDVDKYLVRLAKVVGCTLLLSNLTSRDRLYHAGSLPKLLLLVLYPIKVRFKILKVPAVVLDEWRTLSNLTLLIYDL